MMMTVLGCTVLLHHHSIITTPRLNVSVAAVGLVWFGVYLTTGVLLSYSPLLLLALAVALTAASLFCALTAGVLVLCSPLLQMAVAGNEIVSVGR
jgi:hypothetical protein